MLLQSFRRKAVSLNAHPSKPSFNDNRNELQLYGQSFLCIHATREHFDGAHAEVSFGDDVLLVRAPKLRNLPRKQGVSRAGPSCSRILAQIPEHSLALGRFRATERREIDCDDCQSDLELRLVQVLRICELKTK